MAHRKRRPAIRAAQPVSTAARSHDATVTRTTRPDGQARLDRSDLVPTIALALAAGCLYVATTARDVVVGDTGDFLTTAATLGVAHPPGYPLLVLIGHAFSLVSIGPLAFRMNLVAAASHAITVAVIFLTARKLGASRIAGTVAATVLAVNPLFWEWSLAIEAFPLNDLLAALLIYFMVRWEAEPARIALLGAAALCGALGAANHLTIVFLIPMVLVIVWRRRRSLTLRAVLLCVAAIVVGLLPYVYIPWAASRAPFLNWGNVASPHDLLRHFLRSDYGTGRLVAAGASPGSPLSRLAGLGRSFTVLESVLLVLGAIAAFRRMRWYFWGVLSSFAVAGPAFVAYANIDVSNLPLLWALSRFFLLPHVIAAPLTAFGVGVVAELVASRAYAARRETIEAAVGACAAAGVVVTAVGHYREIDQSRNHLASSFASDVLRTLEPKSVLLALGDEAVFPLAYAQAVEKQRPDVTLVMLGLFRSFGWYIEQLRRRGLIVPFEQYDPDNPAATLRALVAANPGRPFAIVGSTPDSSLSGSYWLYRRGVVEQIERMATDIGLDAAAQENDRLLRAYRLPDPATVRRNTFEIAILGYYTRAATAMADQFALAHLDGQAHAWYERALAIDPEAAGVREAIARFGSDHSR